MLENVIIRFYCDKELDKKDGTALRGFFWNLFKNRAEFHHHGVNGLIYKYPLIQYKIIDKIAVITGIKEGAYLLKALPEFSIRFQNFFARKCCIEFSYFLTTIFLRYSFSLTFTKLQKSSYNSKNFSSLAKA